ncbi:MAG: hypothetical protein KGH65_01730 [Candidatus Micrarchaeota archaeon]|nr:hypothetical protein [Candidatus Micrarchaeota archaeon]
MFKGQLSVEFLIYLSLAGLSLLFATGVLSTAGPSLRNSMDYYVTSTLIGQINDAILSSASGITISGFLPKGICNSSISGETLSTDYGKFGFIGGISLPPKLFCPDGQTADFNIQYDSGNIELIRVV